MGLRISKEVRELFNARNWAFLATLMPDGSPHLTPVWVDLQGEHILINTTQGFRKERNVRRDPRVAVAVMSMDDPETYVGVRGKVVEIDSDDAEKHIDRLARKYLDRDGFPWRQPGENRVILRIEAEGMYAQFYHATADTHVVRVWE